MKIIECFRLNNGMTVLSCEMFSDDQITRMIRVYGRLLTDFEVERPRECFSVPNLRNVVVHEKIAENPKELLFVRSAAVEK